MNMDIAVLMDIKNQVQTEDRRHCDALCFLKELASNRAIAWDVVEHIEEVCKPIRDKNRAIAAAADHAINIELNNSSMQLPIANAPAPLSAEENALLEQAWKTFFNI